MARMIQARLDIEAEEALLEATGRLGLSTSEAVRQGLKLLAASGAPRRRRFIGAGSVDSGIPDLATNPKYMEDFGKW